MYVFFSCLVPRLSPSLDKHRSRDTVFVTITEYEGHCLQRELDRICAHARDRSFKMAHYYTQCMYMHTHKTEWLNDTRMSKNGEKLDRKIS